MKKKRAPEVRNHLAALKGKMARKGAESEEIVVAFLAQHADVIAREIADLKFIALMKLVGQVGSTRAKGATATQLEMFSEYAVPNTILVHTSDGRRVHRHVQSMKPPEARNYTRGASTTRTTLKVSGGCLRTRSSPRTFMCRTNICRSI